MSGSIRAASGSMAEGQQPGTNNRGQTIIYAKEKPKKIVAPNSMRLALLPVPLATPAADLHGRVVGVSPGRQGHSRMRGSK